LREKPFYRFLNFRDGISLRREALHRLSFSINQKLGEVPLDSVAHKPGQFILKVLPQWVSVRTIYFDLGEHVKVNSFADRELLDLLIGARLLRAELVAGETKDGQPRAVFVVKLRQLGVVYGGQTSFGRHVHDQHRAAPVVFHRDIVAIYAGGVEAIDVIVCRLGGLSAPAGQSGEYQLCEYRQLHGGAASVQLRLVPKELLR